MKQGKQLAVEMAKVIQTLALVITSLCLFKAEHQWSGFKDQEAG